MDLTKLTLKEAVEFSKKNGAQPVLDAFQKRAGSLNPGINAFLRFNSFQERMLIPDNHAPLAGVPISVKDNICIEGWEVTCASKILAKHVPPYDATVI